MKALQKQKMKRIADNILYIIEESFYNMNLLILFLMLLIYVSYKQQYSDNGNTATKNISVLSGNTLRVGDEQIRLIGIHTANPKNESACPDDIALAAAAANEARIWLNQRRRVDVKRYGIDGQGNSIVDIKRKSHGTQPITETLSEHLVEKRLAIPWTEYKSKMTACNEG